MQAPTPGGQSACRHNVVVLRRAAMSSHATNAILRLPRVKEITGLGRSTIYLYMSQGTFPKQRKLGERAVGWRSGDVFRWVAERNVAN